MKLHFVRVPVDDSEHAEAELNRFLGGHRIVSVDRQLIVDGARSAWAVCVTYVESAGTATAASSDGSAEPGKKARPDYRELLTPDAFRRFVALRDLRKRLADRDGVPPYAVFTNEQLAAIVRGPVTSLAELAAIDGVGPARVEKYGRPVLEALAELAVTTSAAARVEEARDHAAP